MLIGLDGCALPRLPLKPYQFVTLLDMLPFSAKRFLEQLLFVESIERELEANHPPHALGRSASQLHELGGRLGLIGLQHLQERAARVFQTWKEGSLSREVALYESREIRTAILAEFQKQLFFVVPPGDRDYYEKPLLSANTASSFPAADEELQLAGKCFALDQTTAAVYHSMRALESGLTALARQLGVPPQPQQMWGQVISEIEAAIKAAPRKNQPPDRLKFLDASSDAATNFRFFKDAWRNHAMHKRNNYDRSKAESILDHVRQFFEDIAAEGIHE